MAWYTKCIKVEVASEVSFNRTRSLAISQYIPFIEDVFREELSLKGQKHQLTVKRIHVMLCNSMVTNKLPAKTFSIHTVE